MATVVTEQQIDELAEQIAREEQIEVINAEIIDRTPDRPAMMVRYTGRDARGGYIRFYYDVDRFDRSNAEWVAAIAREKAINRLYPAPDMRDWDPMTDHAF